MIAAGLAMPDTDGREAVADRATTVELDRSQTHAARTLELVVLSGHAD